MSSEVDYKVIPVNTPYIKPGEPYTPILDNAIPLLKDNDYLIISETPLAVSQSRLIDESQFNPSWSAIFLAKYWSQYLWGYFLGPLFRIKKRTIKNLKTLPIEAQAHKEVILRYYGWKHALKPASEAGVDLSNVPGSLVSLLPREPEALANQIDEYIMKLTGLNVNVIIVDTDATYKLAGRYFTSLPCSISPIMNNLGIFGYLLGRIARKSSPTPLGVSRVSELEKILEVASIAETWQKSNVSNLETVYDMKREFNGSISDITIKMLDSITHTPAVIVRDLSDH